MTISAKFKGRCTKCGSWFSAGTLIVWAKGAGAVHADADKCHAPAAAPVKATVNLKSVADFLGAAKARGLKFPTARFLAPGGGELRLYVAGARSNFPGSIQVKIGHDWIGRVNLDGAVAGPLNDRPDVIATLTKVAADPVTAAKEYGALSGRCSFCNLPITDAGSVEVGYGPVCAKHWGLPHHPKGTPTLTKVVEVPAVPVADDKAYFETLFA